MLKEEYVGHDVPKLGFGLMRLPTLESKEIDLQAVNAMVDRFMENGFTYFDTAYGYMGEQSEVTVRRAITDRYPRDSFLLATKLPPWHIKQKEDMERLFATQLERTNAGYFDYYLLHSVNSGSLKILDEVDAWGFIKQKKAAGLARHIGFSYHDNADLLDELLAKHPEIEFVQLQINYADWDDEKVQSRRCYEVTRRHNRSVIVMEPVKGGNLAALNDEARAVLEKARPDASPASWAMRYTASLDGVITVLSGMSSMEQVEDNISTLKRFEPMTEAEYGVIKQVRDILAAIPTTPCTNCKYCVEQCPQNIPIPAIIEVDNRRRIFGYVDEGFYSMITRGKGKASDCIACGVCESRCPQQIEIITLLQDCAAIFE